MKQVRRYRRRGKGGGLIDEWPSTAMAPEELAERVAYIGSAEHKARPIDPAFDFAPALRSDASRCDPAATKDQAQAALQEAVRRRCVSRVFVGEFPQYVWGWLDGAHAARLINSEAGWYKAWPITRDELPADHEGVLTPLEPDQ
ncbi:MAG: hypothetical protein IPL61_08075 [Myxococcales bacterium]|nr:hypothetical protein [Myxococcales bacterium]